MIGINHSLQMIALGQLGADYIDDTADRIGDWATITVLVDATFTKLGTSTYKKNGTIVTDLGAISIPKGITIYGRFTEIQLNLGTIVAYRATASAT